MAETTSHIDLPRAEAAVRELLLAIGECHGHAAARIAIAIGTELEHFDPSEFERCVDDLIGRHRATTARES